MWQMEAFKAIAFIGIGVFLWFFSDVWLSWSGWDRWVIGALPIAYGGFKLYRANRIARKHRENGATLDQNEVE